MFEEFQEMPAIHPQRYETSQNKRKSLKKPSLQKTGSPTRKGRPIDKMIEDELNVSDLATPRELNEEQKKNLYKKYNVDSQDHKVRVVSQKKLQEEKRKY